jgi:hypothetical protein
MDLVRLKPDATYGSVIRGPVEVGRYVQGLKSDATYDSYDRVADSQARAASTRAAVEGWE